MLRFYCFWSLGCDYPLILLLFYLWDVIMLRFYCFFILGCDYPLILLFLSLGCDYAFFIFGTWLCFDSIVFLSWDVIILRFYYHVNFFYCNFISLVLLFFSLNFSFFQLFSSFLFFDGSPIDKYSYLFIFYKIIISKITIKKNE